MALSHEKGKRVIEMVLRRSREGLKPLGTLHDGRAPQGTKGQALRDLANLSAKLRSNKPQS